MADQFLQTLSGFTTGTGTVTVVLPGVSAGSALCAFAMDGTGGNNVTVSDGQGSYTQGVAAGPDSNVCYLQPAYLENANAGSHSVTIDTHSGSASAFLTITEVQSSGVGAVKGTNSASQSLSAGADLIQSGTVTFSTPCTVVGFATDTGNVGALNVPAVGTSPLAFSQRDSNFNVAIGSWLLETVAGSATAGATAGAQTGSNFESGVIVVQNGTPLPTVTKSPLNKNVVVGTTAAFEVAGIASAGVLHYQWKKAGVNVGTDSSTYTTGATTSSDQRADIYCVLTDDNGSVDSGHATLTLSWHDVYLYAMPEDTDPDDVRLRDPTAFAATGAFTLTLTKGVYSLVGNSINLRATRQLVLTKGEYTFTGKSIGLAFGARVTGTKGVYTLVGNPINLRATRQLLITAGVYRLVGNNIDLRAGRQLALTKGVYSLVGNNIDLRAARQLVLTTGRYTLNGNDITLTKTASNSLEITQGQYRLTGNDIFLRATRQLILATGRYNLVGQSITLSAGRQLLLTAGRYELVGKDITLRAARTLTLTKGVYTLNGNDINLEFAAAGAHTLTVTQGRYALTGNPIELTAQQAPAPAPAADDFTQAKYGSANVKFKPLKPTPAVMKAPLPAQITNMPDAPILAPRRGPLMEIMETLYREPLLRKPPPPEAPAPAVAVVKPKPKPAPKPKAAVVEAPPAIDYEAAMRALHESHEREREELEAQLASLQARLALADAMAEAQRERARIERAEAERVAEKRRKNQQLAARLSAELLSDDN